MCWFHHLFSVISDLNDRLTFWLSNDIAGIVVVVARFEMRTLEVDFSSRRCCYSSTSPVPSCPLSLRHWRVCVFHFFLLCTLYFDFELGWFLLRLICSATVAVTCSCRSPWGILLSCHAGVSLCSVTGLLDLRFIFSANRLVLLSILFRLRLLSMSVAGLDPIWVRHDVVWRSVLLKLQMQGGSLLVMERSVEGWRFAYGSFVVSHSDIIILVQRLAPDLL